MHSDLHQDHVISQLSHVMSTSILVQRVDPKVTTTGVTGLCSLTHQRKSGKVLRKVSHSMYFKYLHDYTIALAPNLYDKAGFLDNPLPNNRLSDPLPTTHLSD